jgi:toxin CcdB
LQFDVFANPVPASRRGYPLVVALQSALLASGGDQVVAPLAPRRHIPGASNRLAPVVRIDDEEFVVVIPRLATLPTRELPHRVANLSNHREALLGAIDLLFYGV